MVWIVGTMHFGMEELIGIFNIYLRIAFLNLFPSESYRNLCNSICITSEWENPTWVPRGQARWDCKKLVNMAGTVYVYNCYASPSLILTESKNLLQQLALCWTPLFMASKNPWRSSLLYRFCAVSFKYIRSEKKGRVQLSDIGWCCTTCLRI